MNAEMFLTQHEELDHRIRRDTDRLRLLRMSLSSIPSASLLADHVRESHLENAVYAERLAEIDRKEADLRREEELMVRLDNQIDQSLERMRNLPDKKAVDYAELLRCRFIMHQSWDSAALSLDISRATVYNWRKSALKVFPMPESPINVMEELSLIIAA